MKFIKIISSFLPGFALAAMFSSCEKTFDDKLQTVSSLGNTATVQVFNAMVNSARNYVYVDGKPVTGSLMVSGSVFPASGTGIGFSLPGGLHNFTVSDTLRTSTQLPLNFAENMQVGKHYTVFMYDTITSPKQKTVLDNIVVPTDTTAMLRFANFVYSPVPVPAFDIFSRRANAVIFSNVALTDVTNFRAVPSNWPDTFNIRIAGTTTNLQNINPSTNVLSDIAAIFTPTRGRSYTLVFRNGYRTAVTTAATVRILSVFANN